MIPQQVYVGMSRDNRLMRWMGRVGVRIQWSHTFLLFLAEKPIVLEADWRGVHQTEFDAAHQADGYLLFTDERLTPETTVALWWYGQGSTGKLYSYGRLVGLLLRLAWEAWHKSRVLATGRLSFICTSFINASAAAVLGQPYVVRPDPSPDEIAASKYLHPVSLEFSPNCSCRYSGQCACCSHAAKAG